MDEKAVQLAFSTLQPICSSLALNHERNTVRKLIYLVSGLDGTVINPLQEYILFPLRVILKKNETRSDDYFEDVIRCITILLNKSVTQRPETFFDMFNCLCISISVPSGACLVKDVSEERKMITITAMSSLCKSLDKRLIGDIFTPDFLLVCGHAVSILLSVITEEKNRNLQCLALQTLIDLTMGHSTGTAPPKYQVNIGDSFASFLPGVTMGLTKVITGDYKQGHSVLSTALHVFGKMLTLVIGDESLSKSKKRKKPIEKVSDDRLQSLQVIRSPEWVKMTCEKIKVSVELISNLKSHQDWRVRTALLNWAESLITECESSLSSCVPCLLEVIVGLVADEYPSISDKSRTVLTGIRDSGTAANAKPLLEILEENLHTLTTSLPLLIRTTEDDKKLYTLKLLNGYLKLLGPKIVGTMLSYSHLSRLSLALIQISELDCSNLKILQEKISAGVLEPISCSHVHERHRKTYKHFVHEQIEKEIVQTCRLLGYYGDIHVLIDHFLDLFHQSSAYRKQAILMINELLLGAIGLGVSLNDVHQNHLPENNPSLSGLIGPLLEEYLSAENINLVLSNEVSEVCLEKDGGPNLQIVPWGKTREQSTLSLEQINSNILQVCLLLEGVANCATVLGKDFRYHLMHVLYPVLEKLGDNCLIVNETAYLTLLEIASASQYSSTNELLCGNSDYLVNSISTRMRHLNRNPSTPGVLQVTLTYSDKEILPLIEDTAYEVLSALDYHYGQNALLLMKVLNSFAVAVRTWHPYDPSQEDQKPQTSQEQVFKRPDLKKKDAPRISILDYLKEFKSNRDIAECEFEIDDSSSQDLTEQLEDDLMDHADEKKEPPPYIKIMSDVMERCGHILSCPDPRLRLLVLDTIAECCHALQAHYDILLPLVHKVWPPLKERFQDEECIVKVKAFDVLNEISGICGEFIRSKCEKDILPKAVYHLEKLSQQSGKAGPAYHFTAKFKLQHKILSGVGRLCRQCDIIEAPLTAVIQSCITYLSCRQPKKLQEACLNSFQHFIHLEPDKVWFYLINIYNPEPFIPPCEDFTVPKIRGSHRRNEYSDNVVLLLDAL